MVKTIKGEIGREALIDNITEEEVVTIAVGLSRED